MFNKIKNITRYYLGINYFCYDFVKLSKMHANFLIFLSLNSVYIGTLLFRLNSSLRFVMTYSLLSYVFSAISMFFVTKLVKKFDNRIITFIGLVIFIIMYLIFLVQMNNVGKLMPLIALLNGVASGFYWTPFGNYMSSYCDKNTEQQVSFTALYANVIALLCPMLSGTVISSFVDKTGYYIIFGLTFLISILTVFYSKFLSPVENNKSKTQIIFALKESFFDKKFRIINSAFFMLGLKEGVFMFFLNALLFKIARNEFIIGLNSMLGGLIGIVASYVASKWLRQDNRIKSMVFLNIFHLIFAIFLFWQYNSISIIIFGLATTFSGVILSIPPVSVFYNILNKANIEKPILSERNLVKEMFLHLGRIISVLVVLLLPATNTYYLFSLLTLILLQFIKILLLKKSLKLD